MKKAKWLLVSLILAFIVFMIQLYNYVGKLNRISQSDQTLNGGDIVFSLQHESNPMKINIESFKALSQLLNRNTGYEYYEIYTQYIEMPEQKKPFYECGTDSLNNQCTGINCIQLSKNLIDESNISIDEGRTFTPEDFILDNSMTLPVLMGYSYSSLYRVGDIFEAEYLYDNYNFKIIGFLTEHSNILTAAYNLDLDKYIIMPSFSIASDITVTDGLKIHYANKTSGLVRLDGIDTRPFYEILVPLLENADAGKYSWTVTPIEYQYKEIFKLNFKQMKIMLGIGAVLLSLVELFLIYRFTKYIFS